MLPEIVMLLVSLAMSLLPMPAARRGARSLRRSVDLLRDAQHHVADHFICQGESPVQLLHRLRFSSGLEDYVVAIDLVLDLVGETALAPEVDMAALGALRLNELEPSFDGSPDRLLFQVRVDDDHHFVRTRHAPVPPSGRTVSPLRAPLPAGSPGAAGAGSRLCEQGCLHPVV